MGGQIGHFSACGCTGTWRHRGENKLICIIKLEIMFLEIKWYSKRRLLLWPCCDWYKITYILYTPLHLHENTNKNQDHNADANHVLSSQTTQIPLVPGYPWTKKNPIKPIDSQILLPMPALFWRKDPLIH